MSLHRPDYNALTATIRGAGTTGILSDRNGDMIARHHGGTQPLIKEGRVIRCTSSSYDYDVEVEGAIWQCVSIIGSVSDIGASEGGLIMEGSNVLVVKVNKNDLKGYIIGAAPYCVEFTNSPTPPVIPRNGLENGACLDDKPKEAVLANRTALTQIAHSGRPLDTEQGEHHITNPDYGASQSLAGPVVGIKASEMAQVRASAIDDRVDIKADTLVKVLATGDSMTYDDGGFTTHEEEVSIYKHERLGSASATTAPFTLGSVKSMFKGFVCAVTKRKSKLVARSRLRIFKGYLGDVFHAFVCNPSTDTSDVVDNTSGLFSGHVGSDGRVTMKSAAGFSIQLTGQIPVPKRMKMPWDPTGNLAKSVSMLSKKAGPFLFKLATRSLELASAEAWRTARVYEGFSDKFSKDFTVPTPAATTAPNADFDETASRSTEVCKKDTFAAINVEPDGSVIIQAGGGCEIIMANGRITLNAPNGIMFASGEDVVTLAGNDAVIKAKNSIDINADQKDVRIKAQNNMQLCAMSNTRGNILIKAHGDPITTLPDKSFENIGGEDYVGSGVAIGGSVLAVGTKKVDCRSEEISIKAYNSFDLSAKDVARVFAPTIVIANKEAGLDIGGSSARLSGQSVGIHTGAQFAVSRHLDMLKTEWLPPASAGLRAASMYASYTASVEPIYTRVMAPVNSKESGKSRTELIPFYSGRTRFGSSARNIVMPLWAKQASFYGLSPKPLGRDPAWEYVNMMLWPGKDPYYASSGNLLTIKEDSNTMAVTWDQIKNTDGTVPEEPLTFDKYPTLG